MIPETKDENGLSEDEKRRHQKSNELTIMDFATIRHYPHLLLVHGSQFLTKDEEARYLKGFRIYEVSKWGLFSVLPVGIKLGLMKSDQPRHVVRRLSIFQVLYICGASYLFSVAFERHWENVGEFSSAHNEALDKLLITWLFGDEKYFDELFPPKS